MSNREIYVQLRLSRTGQSELRYAVSLAQRLKATLVVVSPYQTDARRVRAIVDACAPEQGSFDQLFPLHGSVPRLPDNALYVGTFAHWPEAERRKSHQLFVGDHVTLCAPNAAPKFLVPFGKGTSGLRAAETAVALARGMPDSEIVFYHTTWQNPAVSSTLALEHMHPGAIAQKAKLEALAHGVSHRFRLETATDVVGGIVTSALAENADLIVMARGVAIALGSHVDQVLVRTTVPTLVTKEVTP